jgi:FtsZ-interacting cell division protein ZipA
MCEALGYKVHTLTRVRIMNISQGGLGVGKWRYFTAPEIEKMNEIIADSQKTDQQLPNRKKENVKGKIKKAKEERVIKVEADEEPTQPFHEYEVVRPTKKRQTGNQWWSNNINQKKKKERPEPEPFPETRKSPARTTPEKNKKAAAAGKPFKRSRKPAGKKANAKGRGDVAKPFNRREQKPSKGRR